MKQLPFLSGLGIAGVISVLIAQPACAEAIAEVTGVRLNQTSSGCDVILETSDRKPLQVFSASIGRIFIADIITTRLRLPDGNIFRVSNPAPGIATVEVTPLDANSIRVKVISSTGVPTAQIVSTSRGLVLSLSPSEDATATRPKPGTTPTRPTGGEPSTQIPSRPTGEGAVAPTVPSTRPIGEDASVPTVPSTRPTGEGAVVPTVPSTRPTGEPGAVVPTVPSTRPGGQVPSTEPVEIIVTAEPFGYRVPNATTATRTDTPIRDIPQSIQVIPQQVIQDQQVIRIEEALRNVSGVTLGGYNEGQGVFIDVRGFQGAPILIDGFRQYGLGGYQNILETANLEQIEVLKGPASILFGEIQPGGVINLVSKRPLSEPFYEAELQIGSRSLFRPRIDFSGPLTADGRVLYRLNALVSTEEPFRDFDTNFQRVLVSPILTWKISDRTDLTLQLEYFNNRQPFDTGRVASGERVLNTPRNFITGEPGDYSESSILNVGYNFEHRFNNNLTLRNAFRYTSRGFSQELAFPFSFDPTTGIITRNFGGFDYYADSYSLQTNMVGKFNTGSVKHTLLFGVDLNRTTDEGSGGFDFDNSLLLDISNPVYGLTPRPDFRNLPPFFNQGVTQNRLGIYLQDQVDLLDNLKLLAGVRYDTVDQTTRNGATQFNPNSSEVDQNDNAWTPRVGIVYQPIRELSLYAAVLIRKIRFSIASLFNTHSMLLLGESQ